MNRRYIDFAPVKGKGDAGAHGAPTGARRPETRPAQTAAQPVRSAQRPHATASTRPVRPVRPAARPVRPTRPQAPRPVQMERPTRVSQQPMDDLSDLEELAEQLAEVTGDDTLIAAESLTISEETTPDFALGEPKFGVVENFQPKFVKAQVAKRPLSGGRSVTQTTMTHTMATAMDMVSDRPATAQNHDQRKMRLPNVPTANQNKVARRPVAKNVYTRTTAPARPNALMAPGSKLTGAGTAANEAAPMEQLKIVSESESHHKIGPILAILGTIILGALAGTAAFLLLPK